MYSMFVAISIRTVKNEDAEKFTNLPFTNLRSYDAWDLTKKVEVKIYLIF